MNTLETPLVPLPPVPGLENLSPTEVADRIRRGAMLTEVVQQWLDRCHEVAAVAFARADRYRDLTGQPAR